MSVAPFLPLGLNRRIGLMGGSFDPPHKGHIHAAMTARTYLDLDLVVWLVSPQNPNKSNNPAHDYETRMALCRAITRHSPIMVSDLEYQIATTKSFDTIQYLKKTRPSHSFVWIGGMDLAQNWHRWYRWQEISEAISLLFIARPPIDLMVRKTRLHLKSNINHFILNKAHVYDLKPKNCFWIPFSPLIKQSSTQLRNEQKFAKAFKTA